MLCSPAMPLWITIFRRLREIACLKSGLGHSIKQRERRRWARSGPVRGARASSAHGATQTLKSQSRRGVPVRCVLRGRGGCRALWGDAVRLDAQVFWSHRGEKCTFDVMVEEFGLATGTCRGPTFARAAPRGSWRQGNGRKSTFTSRGRRATSTVARAGGAVSKLSRFGPSLPNAAGLRRPRQ